jgi:hypothetical protein
MTKTVRAKIDETYLRRLVTEELQALHEAVDHEGVRGVVNGASKMLKAVEAFEKDANGAMTNALTPGLEQLKATLESMIANPGTFVDRPVASAQTIKLRQVSDED